MPVAIEHPNGQRVDTPPEAGHPVMPVTPNAITTRRKSEVLSSAKSDPANAEVTADYPHMRIHRQPPATPLPSHTTASPAVTRTRDNLPATRTAAVNQLAALLDSHRHEKPHDPAPPGTTSHAMSRPDFDLEVDTTGVMRPPP